MQVSRGIETAIEEGIEEMVIENTGIEEVSRNKPSNVRTEAQSVHQLSRR